MDAYGFTLAEEQGWGAIATLITFAIAVVLLVVFVVTQSKVKNPLLPLRVVTDRRRGGSYLSAGLAMAGNFAQFLFLTFYMQQVLGFTPLQTGFAFLPLVAALVVGTTWIGPAFAARFPVRWVMGAGYFVAALGMVWLTRLTTGDDYLIVVVPGTLLVGFGIGSALICSIMTATTGVRNEDAGVASAMVNTSQQVGGSIGTALMSAIAAGATAAWLTANTGGSAATAAVVGYGAAFWWAAGILLLAAITAFFLVTENKNADSNADADADAPASASVLHAGI